MKNLFTGESNRRLTRSCCGDSDKIAKKIDYGGSTGNTSRHKTEDCVGTSKSLTDKSSQNQVKDSMKCSNDDCDPADKSVLDDKVNIGVSSIKELHVLNDELPKKHIDVSGKRTDGRVVELPKRVGTKRKRYNVKNDVKISHGWSKDQELALERAYLIANPTPHFWKKVSRMVIHCYLKISVFLFFTMLNSVASILLISFVFQVPGKSAQECFDKIHCSHLTPPQPRHRSRALAVISQNNLAASKLLDSASQKVEKPRSRRQKRHIIQRTVRHMLQKQYKVEKDSDSDLFSVLEPASSPSRRLLTTTQEGTKKRQDGSLTAYKNTCSRFSSSNETPIFSPPVLKQVKNIALHEKYIDQLNCREANRKAASSKEEKKGITHDSSVRRKDAIKAAKNALVFDAKDAISQFQDLQVNALSIIYDDESDSDKENEGQCLFSF